MAWELTNEQTRADEHFLVVGSFLHKVVLTLKTNYGIGHGLINRVESARATHQTGGRL